MSTERTSHHVIGPSTAQERPLALLWIAGALEARAEELVPAECRLTGEPVDTRIEHVMSYTGA